MACINKTGWADALFSFLLIHIVPPFLSTPSIIVIMSDAPAATAPESSARAPRAATIKKPAAVAAKKAPTAKKAVAKPKAKEPKTKDAKAGGRPSWKEIITVRFSAVCHLLYADCVFRNAFLITKRKCARVCRA